MQDSITEILSSNKYFHIKLGLERIKKLLNLFDNPQEKLKCIQVAGTNGKGSVCQILNRILIENGYKVGLYTSPHIFEYNERIRINDCCINNDELKLLIQSVIDIANKHSIELTEFEILTAAAFIYFSKNSVDYAILETGLGGRFDATNVIKSNVMAIITHIDLEHTEILGNTIDEISFEKAGIIKQNCPLIIGEYNKIIHNIAKQKNSKIHFAQSSNKEFSLKGEHQKFNLGLAIKACELLNLSIKDDTLNKIKNPCRFEYLKDYNVIVDVAHNPNGILALRKTLDENFPNQSFDFIFNCLATKDYKKMLELLLKDEDKLYIFEFSNPKALKYRDFESISKGQIFKFSDYKKTKRLTVICGSFYMLKELFNTMGIKYNMNSLIS